MRRSTVHLLCVSQRHGGWNQKISTLDSSDQRTDFQRSKVHCSCFLAQASLFLLLVSFGSGFFAAIRPWRPDSCSLLWTVDVEMCLLLNSVKHLFGLQFLRLVTLMNLSFAADVTLFLSRKPVFMESQFSMKASFFTALDGFFNCTWGNFQSSGTSNWLLYTTPTLSQHNWFAQTH